ncbi:metallophosphoesterase family protein [Nocardioides ungokensis]|uniref:metallophosphoesterase family protein n=1 Tax=Nocardioides ungokensis TaxID=1643322 RepID=UPI0015E006C6|nr:metallophosphoesterase [Nocardioides ungokensis]
MVRSRTRTMSAVGLAGLLVAAVGGTVFGAGSGPATGPDSWPYPAESDGSTHSVVLAAVGDIACEPDGDVTPQPDAKYLCGGKPDYQSAEVATAAQVEAMKPDLVALLGDEQYQVGRLNDFTRGFDQTYGAFKFLHRPIPGNHEYYAYKDGERAQDGDGYFAYYNGHQTDSAGAPVLDAAGNPAPLADGQAAHTRDGWYSYDLGRWHVIALNAECAGQAGGCDQAGAWVGRQTAWLASDLAADHAPCTLAYWHQPVFTAMNNPSAEGAMSRTWWRMLYAAGADLVLNGHEHLYARFAPQTPDGRVDPDYGIRELIVGTGGEGLDPLAAGMPNVEAGQDQGYGAMQLTLGQHGYAWSYRTVQGPAYTDSGSASCHGAPQQP